MYRQAELNDFDTIVRLVKSVDGDDRKLEYKQFIVAVLNTNIVGCIRTVQIEADCKEVASLVVLPEFRKQGVGSTLLEKVLEQDKQRPLYIVCTNDKQAFYEKHNFVLSPIDTVPATLRRDYQEMYKENNSFIIMITKA